MPAVAWSWETTTWSGFCPGTLFSIVTLSRSSMLVSHRVLIQKPDGFRGHTRMDIEPRTLVRSVPTARAGVPAVTRAPKATAHPATDPGLSVLANVGPVLATAPALEKHGLIRKPR